MLVNSNKDEILKLAKCFYDVTHTLLTVYDANKNIICSYPNKMCQFCNEIRKSKELAANCIMNDNAALEKCRETHSVYSYKCHMGLIEVAAPIVYNDIVIGYMLFGQISDSKDKTLISKNLKQLSEKYSLNIDALESGIQKIKYRSPEYIESISRLIEMCANYIWQNSYINIKNNTFAHAIDTYIYNNLDKKISVDLICKEFHISRSNLYSISKEYFNCGISEYVNKCKMSKAKILLIENIPVYHVADKLGFEDVNYFIRQFKKNYGITPKQFQIKHL